MLLRAAATLSLSLKACMERSVEDFEEYLISGKLIKHGALANDHLLRLVFSSNTCPPSERAKTYPMSGRHLAEESIADEDVPKQSKISPCSQ